MCVALLSWPGASSRHAHSAAEGARHSWPPRPRPVRRRRSLAAVVAVQAQHVRPPRAQAASCVVSMRHQRSGVVSAHQSSQAGARASCAAARRLLELDRRPGALERPLATARSRQQRAPFADLPSPGCCYSPPSPSHPERCSIGRPALHPIVRWPASSSRTPAQPRTRGSVVRSPKRPLRLSIRLENCEASLQPHVTQTRPCQLLVACAILAHRLLLRRIFLRRGLLNLSGHTAVDASALLGQHGLLRESTWTWWLSCGLSVSHFFGV